jgi:predicted phage tail protein
METKLIPFPTTPVVSIVKVPSALPECASELAIRPVRIIVNLNPFRIEERRVVEIAPLENESLGAIVTRAFPANDVTPDDYLFSLNGERIPDENVWNTAIQHGQEIVLFPKAAGGKVWEMGAMAVLTAVVAYFAPYLTPVVGATWAGVITSAVMVAGSMLISWAFAPGQSSASSYSQSYDPTGPKGLAQAGTPVPKGAGTFGWCGNIVSSYVSFAGAKAYINVLVCYGWGKAKSIKNVLINKQSISNFSDCSYQTRLGTNDQTAIDGFDSTVNGYPQEIQMLVANGPIVVSGTGTNIQGLQITVKFPSGLYSVTNDGNYVNCHFVYKIEVAAHDTEKWTAPLFPNMDDMSTVATFHTGDTTETWPAWVVVPTDQFAGSGLVYDSSNDSHTAGEAWSKTEDVTVVSITGSTSTTTHTFKGTWQPCDSNTNPVKCKSWHEGYINVSANSLSAIFDTQCVYGLTPGRWDVRVTKIGWFQNAHSINYTDSSKASQVCDGWLWNINELFWSNLSYPNMILLGVKALATSQLSGSSIQVMATITHELGEDTVIPALLSSYETDNPAIVSYDLLTNTLYGMGVAASLIDLPAFAAWAAFNDELVTNQDGTQVRRHIFDGVFDQSGNAWKSLQYIASMSRASILQLGMRYTVILDAPADPVQLFTVGNMKKDSFSEQWLALDDRCTLIEASFADAERSYRTDLPVSVMTESDINSGEQPKTTQTTLTGCTSRDQAWRWAYFHLMSTKLTLRTISFTAPVEAVCCTLGSVIAVQSDVVQWALGGRVQSGSTLTALAVENTDLEFTAASGYTVSVQHPVVERGTSTILSVSSLTLTMTGTLPTGRICKAVAPDGTEYIVTGYGTTTLTLASVSGPASATPLASGQVLTLYDVNVVENLSVTGITVTPASPTNRGGSVISVSGSFVAIPTEDSAWAYGQSSGAQPAKLFRVVSIKKSGDFSFEIGAMEYHSESYEDVTPSYGEIVGVPDSSAAITNLTLTEQYQNGALTGSTSTSLVAVGWKNENTAVGAKVEVQTAGGSWNSLGTIEGSSCTFVGYSGTTYNVKVTGVDWAGNAVGTPVTASITISASTNAPANVTGFACAVSGSTLVLTWDAATDADHYEIRYADSQAYYPWLTATVLWDGAGTTWTDSAIRTGMYMIVAVGPAASGGIESAVPAYLTPYPEPLIVTITQSATSGTSSSSTASDAVTVTSTGITTASKVWLTIAWTWSDTYRTPTGFELVAFTGSDATNTANYLFDIVTVTASARSYTVAMTPSSGMTVNAAVRAVYA